MRKILSIILILYSFIGISQENLDTLKIENWYNWSDTTKTWKYNGSWTTIGNQKFERLLIKYITNNTEKISSETFKTGNRIDSTIIYPNIYQIVKEIYVDENNSYTKSYRLDKESNSFRLESNFNFTSIGCGYRSGKILYRSKTAYSHGHNEKVRHFLYCNDNLVKKYTVNKFKIKSYKEIEARYSNSSQKLIRKTLTRIKGRDTTYNCITDYQYNDTLLMKITYITHSGSEKKYYSFGSLSETVYTYDNGLRISETHSQNDYFNREIKSTLAYLYKYDDKSRLIERIEQRPSKYKGELINYRKQEIIYFD